VREAGWPFFMAESTAPVPVVGDGSQNPEVCLDLCDS